jgi:hypothetical protein
MFHAAKPADRQVGAIPLHAVLLAGAAACEDALMALFDNFG